MTVVTRLTGTVAAVCPVHGVSIGTPGVSASVRIDFADGATAQQRAAAQAAVESFDWSDAAHQQWLEDQKPERKTLRQAAAQAVADNNAFLADGSVSNAELLAQVRRLTQQMNAVIRRLIQID